MNTKMRTLAAALLIAMAPAVSAQTDPGTTEQNRGQALVASKIASNFTSLAGGKDNSLALVNALRTGTDVKLVTEVPPPAGSPPGTLPTTTTTTFTPPTKPMGWGNVKHALSLAQDQLSRAGITNPTAEQLQTALMGGDLVRTNADGTTSTTSVKGVLTMRADGMGWGNIAKEGGTKLGQVRPKVDMSNKPAATTTTTSTGVTTAAGPTAPTLKTSKGVTTAAGAGSTTTHGKGVVTAGGGNAGSHGNAYGKGIVTGAGGGSTHVAAVGHGKGNSSGAGVVTGGGNAASGVTTGGGNSNAGGNGKGNGNGKGKGG